MDLCHIPGLLVLVPVEGPLITPQVLWQNPHPTASKKLVLRHAAAALCLSTNSESLMGALELEHTSHTATPSP